MEILWRQKVKDVENIDRMCLNINRKVKKGGVTRQQWIWSTLTDKKLTLETLLYQENENCTQTCNDEGYNFSPQMLVTKLSSSKTIKMTKHYLWTHFTGLFQQHFSLQFVMVLRETYGVRPQSMGFWEAALSIFEVQKTLLDRCEVKYHLI